MKLYLEAKTNIPDVVIDFIEVRLKSGKEVSLNWDESDISRSEDGFDTRYKGVYFGDEYANGRIDELDGLKITDIGLYYESTGNFHFQIIEMLFEDYDKSLTVMYPEMPHDCSSLSDIETRLFDEASQSVLSSNVEQNRFTKNTNGILCFDSIAGQEVVCVDLCYDNDAALPECDVVNLFTGAATAENVQSARLLLNNLAETYHIPVHEEASDKEVSKASLSDQIQSAKALANTNHVSADLIDKDKLQAYLKEDMILAFSSAEECMEYFNTYDYQNFKSVDEMKTYQGAYGFGHEGKWYHISFDEALDVRKEPSRTNKEPER